MVSTQLFAGRGRPAPSTGVGAIRISDTQRSPMSGGSDLFHVGALPPYEKCEHLNHHLPQFHGKNRLRSTQSVAPPPHLRADIVFIAHVDLLPTALWWSSR